MFRSLGLALVFCPFVVGEAGSFSGSRPRWLVFLVLFVIRWISARLTNAVTFGDLGVAFFALVRLVWASVLVASDAIDRDRLALTATYKNSVVLVVDAAVEASRL